ncbi:flavorubredoxin [Acetivibrio thermocellus AD2]|jgi:flavorubredoxin|uniref:Flavorubredoxin n=1 Tax=Acetivibrio thermocellus AD2 TaxID=1138384 RepID=A0AB36TEK2_ACETH|nr:FprA family A-type flavoprotein [Acetivibrio thermocellus]ADU73449.1 flavodoxin/nitric oxide synthase [Acetivibrio thermocellus DSM 1313]ALX07371.1 beta-lactamase domain protein [Acetivibrio thermocellus AD2]ANV75109.1 beta-lactamase domain protein [Acetivibrio thermocellus DSM 2360]EIC04162.1 flavodoxin/nitric oxide synthase [Acetivibrio thermocellus YS]PFH01635.1 flavorubredoxin [Acetivibrio thermocellus AD2]
MNAIRLADNIFWVGKVDDRKVPFHRLILERGTTYNSYLLMTEKPTVIDTVDIEFGKEYVDNLSKIIDPENIEYIVINHVEPDHAGALPALAAKAKNAKIVTTKLASELLKDMFKLHNREFAIIKDGDTLDIGGKTLSFFETPYLHTEETMITYVNENKILFPCDIFSTHIANYELFNDLEKGEYIEDFKVYYRLIMAPHRPYVRDMLEKIKKLNIEVIAPSHGYILRENTAKFIQMYDEMSSLAALKQPKKVTIVYSTMTGNTAKIAQKLVQGLESAGVETSVFNLKNSDLAEVRKKITESDGILVGSSTRYADMVGNVEELLKLLEGEEVKNKFAAAFGSYGWSGEAIMHIENYLDKIGFNVINQKYLIGSAGIDIPLFPLRIKFARQEGLELAEEAGRVFGEQVLTH